MEDIMNIIVFEGQDEVIVATAANVNAVIKDWFLEGQRCLDNYDIYLVDGKGFSITTKVKFDDGNRVDFDVTELMPHSLREALIKAELLSEDCTGDASLYA